MKSHAKLKKKNVCKAVTVHRMTDREETRLSEMLLWALLFSLTPRNAICRVLFVCLRVMEIFIHSFVSVRVLRSSTGSTLNRSLNYKGQRLTSIQYWKARFKCPCLMLLLETSKLSKTSLAASYIYRRLERFVASAKADLLQVDHIHDMVYNGDFESTLRRS